MFVNTISTEQIYNLIAEALINGNYRVSVKENWDKCKQDNYLSFIEHWQILTERFLIELASLLRAVCGIDNGTEYQVIIDAIQIYWIKYAERF